MAVRVSVSDKQRQVDNYEREREERQSGEAGSVGDASAKESRLRSSDVCYAREREFSGREDSWTRKKRTKDGSKTVLGVFFFVFLPRLLR